MHRISFQTITFPLLAIGLVTVMLSNGIARLSNSETVRVAQPQSTQVDASKANPPKLKLPKPNAIDTSKPKPDKDEGWTMFRANENSTGVATSSLPDKLDILWQHEIKDGAFHSTPTIVGGDSKRVYIGDLDGRLLSFDLESGKVIWEHQLKEQLGYVTAAVVKNDRIFLGDIDGIFHCFSTKGKELWKYTTDAEISSSANFYKTNVLFGSQDSKLYALNTEDGKRAWQMETADEVRCSVTVVENRAFVAGCDGALHIVNLENGTETGAVVVNSPTGVTPAARGDIVFVGTEQGGFYAINWKTAKVVWRFDDPQGGLTTRSSPAVKGEHVVFGSRNRKVYSLNATTGKINWSTVLKRRIDSSPVIVGDRVYVGSADGRLYALDLKTGKIVWEKQLSGEIVGSPAVAFGRLVIATDHGLVYCFGKKK